MKIDTIKVEHDGKRGFKVINKCDFIEGIHKEYQEKKKTPKDLLIEEAVALEIENPEGLTVTQLKARIKKMKE